MNETLADNKSNVEEENPQSEGVTVEKEIANTTIQTEEDSHNVAHDDFDWSVSNKNATFYSEDEKKKLNAMYQNSYGDITVKTVVPGRVVGFTENDAIISVGLKSDGMVSLNEFRDMEETIKVNDIVDVMVIEKEDKKGNLILSHKETKAKKAWDKIVKANETGEIVIGKVIDKSRGGLIVNLFDIEVFLPGSQIEMRVVTDYDQYVGRKMEFKVVKVNANIQNAVVSHKAIVEGRIEEQRISIMSNLEKGQVVEGIVKNITDFGVFMDLGDIDGLLYITDIAWTRINHPSDMFELDQKVNVVILDFDHEKKRISLGLKQLSPHPWNTIPEDIKEGAEVEGKVVNVEDYGGFIEVLPGVEGLVHVSEISWANTPVNSKEFFKVGEVCKAKVISFDKEARKMSLSIKQLEPDPWESMAEQLREGTKHKGVVKNITNYGVFVELESGFGGMIHVSDLSWTRRVRHPKEIVSLEDGIDVVILNVDQESRKVLLGHKQVEPNPWELLAGLFAEGTTHEGTISFQKGEGGAMATLPNDMEGYVPSKHMLKEDKKTSLAVGDTAKFIVLEFDAHEKKLVVSHRKVWEKKKEEAAEEVQKEVKEIKKTIASKNKVEKSVLGDIEGLAGIKQKMKDSEEEDK